MKELIVELDGYCPNTCLHCSSAVVNTLPRISLKRYRQLLTMVSAYGFKNAVFSGGEPLCCLDLPKFIDVCAEHNFHVKIYTSGCGRQSIIDTLCEQASQGKISSIVFSCYSASEATHDSLTGNVGSFKRMNALMKKMTKADVKIELNFVPTLLNYKELKNTYNFYYSTFEKFNILKLVPQGRAVFNWEQLYLPDEYVHEELTHITNKIKLNVGKSFLFGSQHGKTKCEAGVDKICVTSDGYIIPCEVFKSDKEKFININAGSIDLIHNTIIEYFGLKHTSQMHGCHKEHLKELLGGIYGTAF